MKIGYLLLLISLVSCTSTDVPIEYRKVSSTALPYGTAVKITSADEAFTQRLKKEIVDDGWLKLFVNEDKKFSEVTFSLISRSGDSSSSERQDKEERIRSVSCRSRGVGSFVLKKAGDKEGVSFDFSGDAAASSENTMPKKPGSKSWRPFVDLISGYSEEDSMKSHQDLNCMLDANDRLNVQMARASLKYIVPEIQRVQIVIEDHEEDMEALEDLIDKRAYDTAFTYLKNLSEKTPRSDIYYNLGVIQEARQNYPDSCASYQKAYELSPKKLYSDQKIACEARFADNIKFK